MFLLHFWYNLISQLFSSASSRELKPLKRGRRLQPHILYFDDAAYFQYPDRLYICLGMISQKALYITPASW